MPIFTRPTRSIVSRLQGVFAAMVVAIAVACAVIGWQMVLLRDTKIAVFDEALPSIVATLTISRISDEAIALTDRTAASRTPDGLDRAREDFARLAGNIDRAVAEIATAAFPDPLSANVEALFSRTGDKIARLLDLQARILAAEARFDDLDMQRIALQETHRTETESLLLEVGSGALDLLSRPEIGRTDLIERFSYLSTLSELDVEIQRIFDRTDLVASLADRAAIAAIDQEIAASLRQVSQTLLSLPDPAMRARLAGDTAMLEGVVRGPGGLLETARTLVSLREERDILIQQEVASARLLNAALTEYAAASEAAIAPAGQAVSAATARMILVASVIVAAVLLPILALNRFVLKRQMGDRMQKLAEAVDRIADGNLDTRIGVDGKDEIAAIADGARIFRQNARDLIRSNADLERFAYVASHDLRSPLKAIRDLATWTLEDGSELSEDSRANLSLILQRVDRLSRLSQDLLVYARLGTETSKLNLFDPEALVADVADIANPDATFRILTEVTAGPVIGPETPIRQILLNLIGNAIKHHDGPPGNIAVKLGVADDRLRIRVEDDGPGIDPAFQERIFQPFQTLKSRDVVEGSGMGLAIVARLVEAYGGRISVVSDPATGRGTTFLLELPVSVLNGDHPLEAAA